MMNFHVVDANGLIELTGCTQEENLPLVPIPAGGVLKLGYANGWYQYYDAQGNLRAYTPAQLSIRASLPNQAAAGGWVFDPSTMSWVKRLP